MFEAAGASASAMGHPQPVFDHFVILNLGELCLPWSSGAPRDHSWSLSAPLVWHVTRWSGRLRHGHQPPLQCSDESFFLAHAFFCQTSHSGVWGAAAASAD